MLFSNRSMIGFMQGRLCNPIDGCIQAFPWQDWKLEFPLAESIAISAMEWTLDYDQLYDNPLMTEEEREINTLSSFTRLKYHP